jgi:c-di-GMP-binding flagellar brake protein YcgR
MQTGLFRALEKLDVLCEDVETNEKVVFSSFIDSVDAESLFICVPQREKEELKSYVGDVLKARITSVECAYFFEAQVIRQHLREGKLWELSLPSYMQRSQQRKYVRVKTILEVILEYIDAKMQRKVTKTYTKDISAGGLQVVMPAVPPEGSNVIISLALDENEVLHAKGEFVRITYPKAEDQKHFASIKFCEMEEKTTERIIKFIFDKEVEQRNRIAYRANDS